MTTAVLLLGFAPPLAWMLLVRAGDRHDREPLPVLLVAFTVGAVGVVAGVVLVGSPVAVVVVEPVYVVAVAPVLEEAGKLLATLAVLAVFRRSVDEPVDPAVYATTVGFGFAAAENVQYFGAVADDPAALAVLFVVRSFGTAVLHGVAAGLAGLALGRAFAGDPVPSVWRRGLPAAVALHAAWNASAYLGLLGLSLGVVLLGVALVAYVRGMRALVARSPHRLRALPPPLTPRLRPPAPPPPA